MLKLLDYERNEGIKGIMQLDTSLLNKIKNGNNARPYI